MKPGHRVERFKVSSRRQAEKLAPWAKTILKSDRFYVAFESDSDVPDELRPVCVDRHDQVFIQSFDSTAVKLTHGAIVGPLMYQAYRRGDLRKP